MNCFLSVLLTVPSQVTLASELIDSSMASSTKKMSPFFYSHAAMLKGKADPQSVSFWLLEEEDTGIFCLLDLMSAFADNSSIKA